MAERCQPRGCLRRRARGSGGRAPRWVLVTVGLAVLFGAALAKILGEKTGSELAMSAQAQLVDAAQMGFVVTAAAISPRFAAWTIVLRVAAAPLYAAAGWIALVVVQRRSSRRRPRPVR